MKVILFEDDRSDAFAPLTLTRPVGELRAGILTIREKWLRILGHPVFHETRPHLQELYPPAPAEGTGYRINARLLPTPAVVDQIRALAAGDRLLEGSTVLAEREGASAGQDHAVHAPAFLLQQLTDLFARNGEAIQGDFTWLTAGRSSQPSGPGVTIIGPVEQLFIEEGAKVLPCMLNTEAGPVYIGRHAEIMEGCMVRGPLALGEQATLRMGTRIYGPTTIGPHCRVGGEVSNSVMLGYSNKGHDGFLGNSVLGEWCNLGADTNTSNLKNNYSEVRAWDYGRQAFVPTGLTFMGLIMGDHGKSGINTMFNTGTVAGVAAQIFGGGFPPKFLPSFSWGGAEGLEEYRLEEALITAHRMMSRRHVDLTDAMRRMLTEVFRITAGERSIATLRQGH